MYKIFTFIYRNLSSLGSSLNNGIYFPEYFFVLGGKGIATIEKCHYRLIIRA